MKMKVSSSASTSIKKIENSDEVKTHQYLEDKGKKGKAQNSEMKDL